MSTLAWKIMTIRSPSLFHNSNTIPAPAPDNSVTTIRLTPPDSPKSGSANSNHSRTSAIVGLQLPPKSLGHRVSKHLLKRPTFVTPLSSQQDSAPAPRYLSFNKHGHRLDEQIRYDPKLRNQFRDRNPMLCFDHHLRKDCQNPDCADEHGEPLAGPALETLRWMARLVPCRDASCSDTLCYFGHICPHNGLCCQDICDFGPHMHDVDAEVAERRPIVSK